MSPRKPLSSPKICTKTTAVSQLAHLFCICVRGNNSPHQQAAVVSSHHSKRETGKLRTADIQTAVPDKAAFAYHSHTLKKQSEWFSPAEGFCRRFNMIIWPNSHPQAPTVQGHTAKTRAADAQRQPPQRPRCVVALRAVISAHKSKNARKTEKEMFSDLKNVPRFLKNYLINNAGLSRGQHLVYAPLNSKLDGWAMVGKKSHKGETKIQKRGPTFKSLKGGHRK